LGHALGALKCAVSLKFCLRDRGAGTDFVEQRRLRRLENHKAAKDIQDVEEFRGVFGRPTLGLNVSEG